MHSQRPLSPPEISTLKENLQHLDRARSLDVRFLTGWTLVALVIGVIIYIKCEAHPYLLAGTILAFISIGVWSFLEDAAKRKKARKNIEYALKINQIDVNEVKTTGYVALQESDDEGVLYLFQLPGNKILSLGGQDFYPTEELPSDHFEIAICYGPRREIVLLETYNYGNKIQPKRVISGQQKWDFLASGKYPDPEKFTVIDGQIEDIEAIILG